MIYIEALSILFSDDLHWTQWSPWQIYIWGCIGLASHWYTFVRRHPSLGRLTVFGALGWILAFGCGPLILVGRVLHRS